MMDLVTRGDRQAWMLLLLCLLFSVMGSWPVLANDSQYRIELGDVVSLGENWKGTMSLESRHDDDGSQIQQHADIGVVYLGVVDWFDVGLRFRNVFRDVDESQWAREHRYYLDMTGRHTVYDVVLNHRVRFEYNNWDNSVDDFGTFRYRIGIDPPHTLSRERERRVLKDHKYRPYARYELTADTHDEEITRHSFEFGLGAEFTDSIIGNLYYKYEKNSSTIDRVDLDIVGLVFKVVL
jgi:hypothetical protein